MAHVLNDLQIWQPYKTTSSWVRTTITQAPEPSGTSTLAKGLQGLVASQVSNVLLLACKAKNMVSHSANGIQAWHAVPTCKQWYDTRK